MRVKSNPRAIGLLIVSLALLAVSVTQMLTQSGGVDAGDE